MLYVSSHFADVAGPDRTPPAVAAVPLSGVSDQDRIVSAVKRDEIVVVAIVEDINGQQYVPVDPFFRSSSASRVRASRSHYQGQASGSGFVYRRPGDIVTNAHVVQPAARRADHEDDGRLRQRRSRAGARRRRPTSASDRRSSRSTTTANCRRRSNSPTRTNSSGPVGDRHRRAARAASRPLRSASSPASTAPSRFRPKTAASSISRACSRPRRRSTPATRADR